jgi:hypothetical protein
VTGTRLRRFPLARIQTESNTFERPSCSQSAWGECAEWHMCGCTLAGPFARRFQAPFLPAAETHLEQDNARLTYVWGLSKWCRFPDHTTFARAPSEAFWVQHRIAGNAFEIEGARCGAGDVGRRWRAQPSGNYVQFGALKLRVSRRL